MSHLHLDMKAEVEAPPPEIEAEMLTVLKGMREPQLLWLLGTVAELLKMRYASK